MNEEHANVYNFRIYSDGSYYPNPLVIATAPRMDIDRFTSLYQISAESARGIGTAGTVAGFNGVVWSERLWLDIDGYDKAERVELKLQELGLDYIAYDSGGKGAHFGVKRTHEPSHLLPKKDKQWVSQTFPEADLSIYTPLHLFRIPGAIHETTGRRKEAVSQRQGTTLTLPEQSQEPIYLTSRKITSYDNSSIFLDPRLGSTVRTVPTGNRHETLVKVCYAAKDKGADAETARWFLEQLNSLFKEPKEEKQVSKVVANIYGKLY